MKITDGKKTIEITIKTWDEMSQSYSNDWSRDYFAAAESYEGTTGIMYVVPDVDYCVEMANSDSAEGARANLNDEGLPLGYPNPNVVVDVTVLDNEPIDLDEVRLILNRNRQ